jgi:hypothetical protein
MKCTIIMYVNSPIKRHSRGFHCKTRSAVLIESTQVRWFSEQSGGRRDPRERQPRMLKGELYNNYGQPRDLVGKLE